MKYDNLTGTYRLGYHAGFGIEHLAKPQAWLNYVNINNDDNVWLSSGINMAVFVWPSGAAQPSSIDIRQTVR